MKLTSSFAALASVVVIALCVEEARADTVTTPLALTKVDDKGVPITPLTYLNLEPSAKELSDAAKKITTPPPLPHEKRLLPADHLEPFIEQFSSQGISLKRGELGHSLLPYLPIIGALDNEGDHTNVPPTTNAAIRKRLLDVLKSLEPSEGTQYLPPNHQTLGNRTPHPLNRRGDDPLEFSILGQDLPPLKDLLPTKLPGSKRKSSGLNIFGESIPINAIPTSDITNPLNMLKLPDSRREVKPLDLGLKTGNKEDMDALQSLLKGLLRRDLDLKAGNEQDLERAKSFFEGLLGGVHEERDSISPDNIDLTSIKEAGNKVAAEAEKDAVPLALAPVKQAASPAVQVVKTAEALCTAFGCIPAAQNTVQGVEKQLPLPPLSPPALGRSLGDKDIFAEGLLHNQGSVAGIPVRRDQNPVVQTVLDTSDEVRDAILGVKTDADNAAGEFVKNMYTKHGEVSTKRAINFPSYSLLPGAGPPAKEAAKELIEFLGIPGTRRMEKVRRSKE